MVTPELRGFLIRSGICDSLKFMGSAFNTAIRDISHWINRSKNKEYEIRNSKYQDREIRSLKI